MEENKQKAETPGISIVDPIANATTVDNDVNVMLKPACFNAIPNIISCAMAIVDGALPFAAASNCFFLSVATSV